MNNDDHERRVAVLIDAENIAPKYLPIVLSEANNLGSVNIKRIYAPRRPSPRVRNLCARHGRTKNPEELHLRLQ